MQNNNMEENRKEDTRLLDNEKKAIEGEITKESKEEIIENAPVKTETTKKSESDEITEPETEEDTTIKYETTETETKENESEDKKEFKKQGHRYRDESEEEPWIPKTKLGNLVKEGKITLDDIFKLGYIIKEPQITDFLIPDLEEELILIGGSPGKGGGIRRSMIRRTVRIHKSGRRLNLSAMVVVGNKNGYLGVGFGRAATNKEAIQKAAKKARMNIFPIRRGCGSAECMCGEEHSIPFTSFGKTGSVLVKLMPAPKGLSLCSPEEIKKIFRLAGIKDIRIKSRGQTGTRINFIYAVEDALKNLSKSKL